MIHATLYLIAIIASSTAIAALPIIYWDRYNYRKAKREYRIADIARRYNLGD